MATLSYRSLALWLLGYPEAALADADQALKDAREIGQAATLMYALVATRRLPISTAETTRQQTRNPMKLSLWRTKKAPCSGRRRNDRAQGCVLALTGKASDAVQMITSGITAWRSTGATVLMPWFLSHLARAYAELGQFDDAWRCIDEAMTAIETTKERWCEAEVNRMAGEIALKSPRAGCGESGSVFRARARGCARAAGKVLGTARRDEHGAAVARSGQAGCRPAIFSPRSTAGSPKGSTRST